MTNIKIVGRTTDTHSVVYSEEFALSVGDSFDPGIGELSRYGQIDLDLIASFGDQAVVRASAKVRKIADIHVHHPSERFIKAAVTHMETRGQAVAIARGGGENRDCLLHCPDTGKRSNGPCIDCSDDEYTIRLCC